MYISREYHYIHLIAEKDQKTEDQETKDQEAKKSTR